MHSKLKELSSTPGLESLAGKLSEKLSSGLLPKAEVNGARKIRTEWDQQRLLYLTARALENGVNSVFLDHELGEAHQSARDGEAVSRLRNALTCAEARDCLEIPFAGEDGNTFRVMGLSAENISSTPLSDDDVCFVQRGLEERLLSSCADLLTQLGMEDIRHAPGKVQYESALKLPEMVRGEVEATLAQVTSQRDSARGPEQFRAEWKTLDVLEKSVDVVQALVSLRTGAQAEADRVAVEHLDIKCKTLVQKIRCLELDILINTYPPSAVDALKKIQKHLKNAIADTEKDLTAAAANLKQYEVVGAEFQNVVSSFAKIKAEIEDRKWAMSELNQNA